jgi:DNA-binding CsgD family transcriptional regulator
LAISPNTVRTHTQRILAKLDVHTSVAAVTIARRASLR